DGYSAVVASSAGTLTSYDASNGNLYWSHDGLTGNTIPSPVAHDSLVVVGAGEGRTGDPKASARSNCCLRLVQKDGAPSYEMVWEGEKGTASYASPLIHNGCVYLVTRVGIVYCVDLQTGKENFAQRIDGSC